MFHLTEKTKEKNHIKKMRYVRLPKVLTTYLPTEEKDVGHPRR